MELRRDADSVKVYVGPRDATRSYAGKADLPVRSGLRVGYGAWAGSVELDDLAVRVSGAATASTPTPAPAPSPASRPTTAPTSTPTPVPGSGSRDVAVGTSDQLARALAGARPGDVITMADGIYTSKGTTASVPVGGKTYSGTFVASARGTAAEPIVLRGSRRAVIDGRPGGDGTGTQYGLYLVGASYWQVRGISVTNVAKGIVLDGTSHSTIESVEVSVTGQEGIHLRAFSSDDVLRSNVVHDTGLRNASYGEGIYVGSASSNWGTYSGGRADRSDRNLLVGNTVSRTGAESMDIKEGTTGGTIQGNTFDGTGMTGSFADSWVDLREGNGWKVVGNRGTTALKDGFQVHGALTGWGLGNTFAGNTAAANAPGYGFWLQSNVTGNVVACDNTATGARSGLSNMRCS